MRSKTVTLICAAALSMVWASADVSAAPVSGEVTEFRAASGLVEQCIRITDFPGAHYTKHDRKTEKDYCELDFAKIAVCPKLWSTSPGTILYEIDGTDYAGFEREHCADDESRRLAQSDHPLPLHPDGEHTQPGIDQIYPGQAGP